MASYTYVVIGASAASIAFMNKITRLDPQCTIICISQEQELPYNKCFLADYCADAKVQQEVLLNTAGIHTRINWLLGTTITQLDPTNKVVITDSGLILGYKKLFLGMGSGPVIPPFARNHPNIFTFHTLNDANRLLSIIQEKKPKTAVIIGAGLSGVECADALHKQGLQVTLIEQKNMIMPAILDEEAAQFLQDHMRAQGVEIITGQTVSSINPEGTQVLLQDQRCLQTDIILVTTGLRPNSGLAAQVGLAIARDGGVIVNQNLQTSDPDIFAAGDLISILNTLTGQQMFSCTWPDAMFGGMMAAQAAFGQPGKPYHGAPIIVNSAFFGLNFAQAGYKEAKSLNGQKITKKGADFYHSFIIENDQLKGFIVLGNTHDFGLLKRHILTGQLFQS